MFLISLLLVSLIVVAVVMENESLTVEQEELIAIPVKDDRAQG